MNGLRHASGPVHTIQPFHKCLPQSIKSTILVNDGGVYSFYVVKLYISQSSLITGIGALTKFIFCWSFRATKFKEKRHSSINQVQQLLFYFFCLGSGWKANKDWKVYPATMERKRCAVNTRFSEETLKKRNCKKCKNLPNLINLVSWFPIR